MNLRSPSYRNGVRPFQVLWVSTASKGRFGPETHLFFFGLGAMLSWQKSCGSRSGLQEMRAILW
jgi:hypothetical protein